MTRDSFIFYASFYEGMRYLDDASYIAVSKAVCEYALFGIEPELTGLCNGIYQMIKPQLDANNKRYNNGSKGAEFGKLGGRPRKENPEKTPMPFFVTPKETPKGFSENPEETPMPFFVNPKETPNGFSGKTPNENENENEKDYKRGELENSAAAEAATQPDRVSDDVLADSIENAASPQEKEKGCAEKEKEPRKTIEEREIDFWKMLEPYTPEYGEQMVRKFFNYWTEYNTNGRKMRWEMEKIFNVKMRLTTWASREKDFDRKNGRTAPQSPAASNSVEDFWKNNNY